MSTDSQPPTDSLQPPGSPPPQAEAGAEGRQPAADLFDPEARQLCPDGACTGLIGDDGRCKSCGRAATGELPESSDSDASASAERAADDDHEPSASFDEDRRLCPDGACIGVIGDDGRCKVCGAAAA